MNLEEELAVKVRNYELLTEEALRKVSVKAKKDSKEYNIAMDYLSMARNYFSDAQHFKQKKDLINSLAALSYAHAWLDAGVRAGILKGEDERLFTQR
ncbi:MAG: DUF357 domain-containing protein [Candidatus Diapherotrites archaeon]